MLRALCFTEKDIAFSDGAYNPVGDGKSRRGEGGRRG